MLDWLLLLAGIGCAALGGELFVRGSVGLARWLRIAPGIVGATVVAFSTSSPELSVSVSSAVAGTPNIAVGDALGSNVVNVALILGIALAISGTRSPRDTLRRDFPVALGVPIATSFLLVDGTLSRLDGALLLAAFLVWLVAAVVHAKKVRSAAAFVLSSRDRLMSLAQCGLGLPLLMLAGTLIVTGAKSIAASLGVAPFVIGATVVSAGTSVPELATTLIAKLRGHDEVSLGAVLGSNIFNGLLVVGIATVIRPIRVPLADVAIALGAGLAALALAYPGRDGRIPRRRGVLLLSLYVGYVTATVLARSGAAP